MEKKNVEQVAQDIIRSLEEAGVVKPGNLQAAKLVLDMHLSKYQLITVETALSTNCDYTYAYLERYLMDMRLRGCTENSIRSYQGDLKNFLAYVDRPVPDILYHDIQRYLAYGKLQRGWNDRTYNTKLIQIRSFFKYLYEEDLIRDNPGKKLHAWSAVLAPLSPRISGRRSGVFALMSGSRPFVICYTVQGPGSVSSVRLIYLILILRLCPQSCMEKGGKNVRYILTLPQSSICCGISRRVRLVTQRFL